MARNLQTLLGHDQWRNFLNVIEKAKIACTNSGHKVSDHFADISKMIKMPKGVEKTINNFMLTVRLLLITKPNACLKTGHFYFALTGLDWLKSGRLGLRSIYVELCFEIAAT